MPSCNAASMRPSSPRLDARRGAPPAQPGFSLGSADASPRLSGLFLRGRRHDLGALRVFPRDARASPYVVDLLGAEDRQLHEGWQETMLRSASERAELDQELGSIEPFWDRKLRYNKKEYRRFVGELDQRGLTNWVTKPQEFASLFCVWKKNGVSRRLVVDARRAIHAFKEPRGVQLLSSEGFSRWEVLPEYAEEVRVELAVVDIDNCFHRHRLPVEMSAHCCLQPLPLKHTPAGRGRSLTRKEALTPSGPRSPRCPWASPGASTWPNGLRRPSCTPRRSALRLLWSTIAAGLWC